MTASDDGIDRTLNEWAAAFAKGDVAALVSLVTSDAEFWTHDAPPFVGRAALQQAFEQFFAQFSAVQEFVEVERVVLGEHAFLRGQELNRLTPAAGGEASELRQRAFSVLRCEADGRWRFCRGMTNQGPLEPQA